MVLKIKKTNNDSINQVRKINILNKQPICKITNHFTETEDSEYLNDIIEEISKELKNLNQNRNKNNWRKLKNPKILQKYLNFESNIYSKLNL